MKRIICILLTLVSVIMILPTGVIAEETEAWPFPDVPPNAWYTEYVTKCHEQGWIKGDEKGNMMPTKPMTRAEAVVLIYNQSETKYGGYARPFNDVPKNAWYINELNWAAVNGIVIGDRNNRFMPNDYVTRQDFILMLYRAYNRFDDTISLHSYIYDCGDYTYKDYQDVSKYASIAVDKFTNTLVMDYTEGAGAMYSEKPILSGFNGYIMPKKECTRSEALTILIKLRQDDIIDAVYHTKVVS